MLKQDLINEIKTIRHENFNILYDASSELLITRLNNKTKKQLTGILIDIKKTTLILRKGKRK